MRDVCVCIVTVDRRPRKNYLQQTLESLAKSGAWRGCRLHSLHVVDSGGSEEWPDNGIIEFAYTDHDLPLGSNLIAVHRSETRRSGKMNFAKALEVGASVGAEWVVILEDDIDVCGDFVDGVGRWLDDHAVLEPTCYPLCGNHITIANRARDGYSSWTYPVAAFWGFQAFAIRPREAESFAKWLHDNPMYVHTDGRLDPESHDLEIHRWAEANGIKTFIGAAPSMVQHVGFDSYINPTRKWDVSFPSWPGRDWSYQSKQQQQTAAGGSR